MLNKANFLVTDFASKEESRYNCQTVQVTPEATVATNGHILAWVSTASMEPENFPVVEGFAGGQKSFKPFLLPVDAAKQIAKALPKKTTIPALGYAAVHTAENGDGTHPSLCVTDLKNPQVWHPRPGTGTFPNYQAVIPKPEDEMFSICVDPDYLATIAKAYSQFEGDSYKKSVLMRFYKPDAMKNGEKCDKAIRFDAKNDNGQGMTVVLMPMRSKGQEDLENTYGWTEREAARVAAEEAKKQAEANAKLGESQAA